VIIKKQKRKEMEHLTPTEVEHWIFVALLAIHVVCYAIKSLREAFKE